VAVDWVVFDYHKRLFNVLGTEWITWWERIEYLPRYSLIQKFWTWNVFNVWKVQILSMALWFLASATVANFSHKYMLWILHLDLNKEFIEYLVPGFFVLWRYLIFAIVDTLWKNKHFVLCTRFFFFSYAFHEPQLISHETASSSAECSRDKPPFSFVRGQDSTMWDIVQDWD